MKLLRLTFLPLLLSLLLPPALAQPSGATVATEVPGRADDGKGAELREQVNEVWALVRARKLAEAERAAVELQKQFQATFDPTKAHYAFHSREELLDFQSTSPQPFEWIDWGYKECLQIQAFIAADRSNFTEALAMLVAIEAIAPVSAGTLTERGFIFNRLGKPEDALLAYRQALALAMRYRSQIGHRAVALRGIGFALIELQKLDDAEAAFQESLKIDPDNKLALSELDYIRGLRAKAAAATL